MAGAVTWDELRELAALDATRGRLISVYVDLDPSLVATAGDVQTRVNSLLDMAGKAEAGENGALTHEQRLGFRSDLDRIRSWFDQEFSRDGTRGVAVFCGSLDGIWITRPVLANVPDEVCLDRWPALAPLAAIVGVGDGGLVLVVGREQGRFLRLRDGHLEPVADLSEEQPGRHDQGGWSQARFQRHIHELTAEHLRDVAEELDRRVRDENGAGLDVVIVAPEETRAELRGLLSREAEQALAGWAHAEAHASPSELLEHVEPVLAERRANREVELLERWREAAAHGRGAGGWPETLEAVSDGRVDVLLVGARARREVWRCPSCGRLSAEEGECPLDGSPMEALANGEDAAIVETLRRGGTVWKTAAPDLGPVEGLAALLRF